MHTFLLNINDFSDQNFNLCLSLMDEKRRQYINSLQHKQGKLLSVAAEWLTKTNASLLLNKPLEEIVLLRDEKGKPFIKDNPLYISISHSGNFAAVTLHTAPIGIDIEVLKPIDKRLKNRICTDSDLLFLTKSQTEAQLNLNLLKIWTAKEAYFKMTGTGITNFKSISYKDINASHSIENSLIITTVT